MSRHEPVPLEKLDPIASWQPWEPDADHPWSLRWAGHLYRRVGFGASLAQLREAVEEGFDVTFKRLTEPSGNAETEYALFSREGEGYAQRNDIVALRGWWLNLLLRSPHPLRDRLTLFWHNHFATSIAKVARADLMYQQYRLLHRHALGKFGPLLLDVSKDAAMLVWLDSNSNVKGKPNENYAREIMELFSLGVGNYSENDIKGAARAFTGWHVRGDRFEFNRDQHDEGDKTVLGETGNLDGGDVVRLCLKQKACARFLVRKLYREFISEANVPPDALLEPLCERLRKSDYDLGDLAKTMLRSRHFFSENAYRKRVKSPTEFVLGTVNAVGQGFVSPNALVGRMEEMGQSLFAPPNVKGWEGGHAWLNSATVLARANYIQVLTGGGGKLNLEDPNARIGVAVDPAVIVRREKVSEAKAVVALLLELLLQGDVSDNARKRLEAFLADAPAQTPARDERVREVIHAIMTMPEYQLA